MIIQAKHTVPTHFEHLASELAQWYVDAGHYDDAIGLDNMILECLNHVAEPESIGFGMIRYNLGFIYSLMKDRTAAWKA